MNPYARLLVPLGLSLPWLLALSYELDSDALFRLLVALALAVAAVLALASLALWISSRRARRLEPALDQLQELGRALEGRVLEASEGQVLVARGSGRTLRVVLQRDGAMRYEVWLRGARGTFQASSPLFIDLQGYRGVEAVRIESAVLPLLHREGRVRLDSDRLLLTRPDGASELRMRRVEVTLGLLTALANLCDAPRRPARERARQSYASDQAAAWALAAHAVRAAKRPLESTRCPFCHDIVERRAPESTPGPECGAPHPQECLAEGRGCAVYGCSSPLRAGTQI